MASPPSPADAREPASERRLLTPFDATMLVMGGIIGVGIFFTPRAVAQAVPATGPFLLLWVVGGLAALSGALTFAELGGTFPRAGGWFVVLREAFGPFVAFLFASVVLCVISTGATAVMMEIFVGNLHGLVPGVGDSGSPSAMAIGAVTIVAVTLAAAAGSKTGAGVQNAIMLLKLFAILVLCGGAFFLATPAPETAREAANGGSALRGFFPALLPVLFAIGGWQHVCYLAHQVRDPSRNVPRATVLGVVGVIVVYLLINSAYLRVLGIEGLVEDTRFAARTAEAVFGPIGSRLLQGAIAISALGVCVVTLVAGPWMYVAMAREKLFFARFAEVHPRTGAPLAALAVQAVLCLAWWFLGNAEQAVDAVVLVEWIFHALAAAALLRLRRRADLPRPFASPLYPLAPLVYLGLAITVVLGNLTRADLRETGIGLGVLAGAALVYPVWRRLVNRATA
jgi:APA family basic amino acid/polyamine antiporter